MNVVAASDDGIEIVPQPRGQRALEVLLIFAVFFIVAGDVPPNVNESHYLCTAQALLEPRVVRG